MASITKRGNKYRVQISIYKHGQHKKISKSFSTKEEANIWALQNELEKGKGTELGHREITLIEFYENWLYTVKAGHIREHTFKGYLWCLQHLKELFEDVKLKDLNDIFIQKKVDKFALTHSRSSTSQFLVKLRTVLKDAYARGYIKSDFISLVKVKGKELPKRNRALSITEFRMLRSYLIDNCDHDFHIMTLIALETGMRRGEILGMKPEDLYEYGIRVKRSVCNTKSDIELKSQSSRRDIAINKEVYDIVRKMKARPNGYLFSSSIDVSYHLPKLLETVGVSKTTFHGLRDTHASYLFSQNIDMMYISKRLGHSNMQTTQNYYLELMPEKKHEQEDEALRLLQVLS
ncbi:TPA: site-specific integrase [Streptococcus suis]|nr:site-specific integrase [Streptococcus suis]